MARQTSVGKLSDRPFAVGQIREGAGHATSRKAGGWTEKVVDLDITAADNTDYTVTLETLSGTTKDKTVNSGAGATTTSIRNLLLDDINGDGDVLYSAESVDANTMRLTCKVLGKDASVAVGANLVATVTTAADAGDTIAFGLGVCQATDENFCELPTLSAAVAQVTHATPAAPNASDTAHFIVVGDFDGDGASETYDIPVTPDAAGVEQTVNNVVTAFTGAITGLAVTDGATHAIFTGPAGLKFEVTANIEGGNGTTVAIAENTASSAKALALPFLGISKYRKMQRADKNEEHHYQPGDTAGVEQDGPIPVTLVTGQTPSFGDKAYLVASGADRGKWRNTEDTLAVLIPGRSFASGAKTGTAGETGAWLDLKR